ncbi:MAG: hypothetical protein ACRESU_08225 [Gammaproteobacteria bacterium]
MHASPEQLIALRDGEPVAATLQTHVRECAECAAGYNSLVELRSQLSRLPDFALPEGAWQAVMAQVEQAESSHGFRHGGLRAAGVAMVASIVIALTLVLFPGIPHRPADNATASDTPTASVPQLMRQSSYLERAVLSLNSDADHMVVSAGTAATVAALEDRIALLDYEINHATADAHNHDRLPQLWQQRVNLMQSLAAVRYAQVASSNI